MNTFFLLLWKSKSDQNKGLRTCSIANDAMKSNKQMVAKVLSGPPDAEHFYIEGAHNWAFVLLILKYANSLVSLINEWRQTHYGLTYAVIIRTESVLTQQCDNWFHAT